MKPASHRRAHSNPPHLPPLHGVLQSPKQQPRLLHAKHVTASDLKGSQVMAQEKERGLVTLHERPESSACKEGISSSATLAVCSRGPSRQSSQPGLLQPLSQITRQRHAVRRGRASVAPNLHTRLSFSTPLMRPIRIVHTGSHRP